MAIITNKVKTGLFCNMKKVMVKTLQGSVVTQTMLGGLTVHPRVANFLECIRAKDYDNWLTAQ